MKQQTEVPNPTYNRHEVHEVVTSQGVVVITDRNGLDIKVRAIGRNLEETEYIDSESADDYCSHDATALWEEGWEAGSNESMSIHKDAAYVVEQKMGDWHDQNHDGPAFNCYEDPCQPIRAALEDARFRMNL